ncbi:aminotransferase class V-fold PLP-dependent enzyme [Fibrella aquatilis]|uniref:Aminotransferase class V-fold PLP-dependent enzyme n=1 Tax=Fibrella aquatilis TaxID=2817059 RepID=A0A939G5Q5_9BACT|nr:aminotransferase class V-fold PLP-dependent enzyme [Fibrella aquatilis]MBO0931693.1 aminotransferase class V-fold PLP-dependent enzyme [Fibrella aquatilis]
MTTFYPGPSKIYPAVAEWAAEACSSGVVSMNHRSPEFMAVTESAMRGLHEKLALPPDYHVALVSSATECWEIVAQSLTARHSVHPYEGAFGQKWMEYAYRIKPVVGAHQPDVLCVVQNETSNGTQVSMAALAQYRRAYPDALVAVDAVSSMAGIVLDWALGDVWFASVQKCFGLPAGLAVVIYSPRALARAEVIGERNHYNSLLFLHDNFSQFQTPYTPNGLGIYLLAQVLKKVPPLAHVDATTKKRAADWYAFFDHEQPHLPFKPLIPAHNTPQTATRSDTVIALTGDEAAIALVKKKAKAAGLLLGNGYGDWKNTTFRIANFPAISDEEIGQLKQFFRQYKG